VDLRKRRTPRAKASGRAGGASHTILHTREAGAGEGNRTLVCSLGSSIEPSPLNYLSAKLFHFGANPVKRLRMERKTFPIRGTIEVLEKIASM
jgi:hypothetical protein